MVGLMRFDWCLVRSIGSSRCKLCASLSSSDDVRLITWRRFSGVWKVGEAGATRRRKGVAEAFGDGACCSASLEPSTSVPDSESSNSSEDSLLLLLLELACTRPFPLPVVGVLWDM